MTDSRRDPAPIRLSVGELQTNCWILPLPDGGSGASSGGGSSGTEKDSPCVLVDPGGEGDRILSRLANLGFCPRYIVLTHGHFDHVAALPELAAAFPAAEIAIHPAEAAKLGPGSLEIHRRDFTAAGAASYVDALWKPLPEPAIFLDEGTVLGPFTVLHLPGHSPGSIALYDGAEKILVSGDTLFYAGVGRADLPGGDGELLERSLRRLFALPSETAVYPGHGPVAAIGRERTRYGAGA